MVTKPKQKRKPSVRAKKAFDKMVENGGVVSTAMIAAGYSENTAKTPQKLTESRAWQDLMEDYLSDEAITQKHKELLQSSRLEHMTFRTGAKNAEERDKHNEEKQAKAIAEGKEFKPDESMTDEEIIEMLADINCTVRRIEHGEMARHVYFWSADNKARKDAIDMAYKLKGSYAAEKKVNLNIEIDSSPRIKELADKLNESFRMVKKEQGESERVSEGISKESKEDAS